MKKFFGTLLLVMAFLLMSNVAYAAFVAEPNPVSVGSNVDFTLTDIPALESGATGEFAISYDSAFLNLMSAEVGGTTDDIDGGSSTLEDITVGLYSAGAGSANLLFENSSLSSIDPFKIILTFLAVAPTGETGVIFSGSYGVTESLVLQQTSEDMMLTLPTTQEPVTISVSTSVAIERNAVPVPAVFSLMLIGFAGLWASRRATGNPVG